MNSCISLSKCQIIVGTNYYQIVLVGPQNFDDPGIKL